MQIFLTAFAKQQIHIIYSYYKEVASIEVAKRIKKEINLAISQLENFPQSGQVEQFMDRYENSYRRLIAGNFKIIYRISDDKIFITDVFDSRQDPGKMNPWL